MKTALLLLMFGFSTGILRAQQAVLPTSLQPSGSSNSTDTAACRISIRPDAVTAFIQNNRPLILRQLSPTTFIVAPKTAGIFRSNTAVVSVQPASSSWKLSPRLLKTYLRLAAGGKQLHNFLLYCRQADSLKNLLAVASPTPATPLYVYKNILLLRCSWTFIADHILPDERITFIDLPASVAKEELSVANFDNSLNAVNKLHNYYPSIDGKNTVVSVKENRPDTADIDFRGRLISTSAASNTLSTHASTMATIIAGGGNSFYTALGVAPAAQISSSSFAVLLPDPDAFYQQYRISVQNHSYGTGIENFYGADAAGYDASTNANPSLLHVFSAGNTGNQAPPDGQYAGIGSFANITGSFKMAKNIITTGAVDSFARVQSLSSRGPAYDGRLKPDLLAFGEDGSSGAAALVSGTALALQQAYQEMYGGALPDAALVKAFLLNAAAAIDSRPVSFSAGYGLLDAYRAVKQVKAGQFFTASLAQAEIKRFTVKVPAAAQQLKILLSWSDPAATPNAFTALVNDLDLAVAHTASGQQWLPWVLNSFPHADSLQLPATRRRDSLNNIEQITIDNPPPGDYTVAVSSSRLPAGTQKFYIVYQWDTANSFEWTYPTKGNNLLPGKQQLPRWKTNISGAAVLEFKYAGSNSWQTIGSLPAITNNYSKWTTPDSNALAILRMSINGRQYLSDSFTISAPLQLAVGFNCPDSALLFWNRQRAVDKYAVSILGSRYMEPHALTGDTAIFISKSTINANWFRVAPLLAFNKTGVYSQAIDYTNQGVNCYLSNFTADLTGNKSSLAINLGTLFGIQRVVVEKQITGGAYQTLQVMPLPLQLQYSITDNALNKGVNQYRVRIELSTGQNIYSSTERIIYLAGKDYLLYPNPVHPQQSLSVITSELGNQLLQVFNVWGQQVITQPLSDLYTPLSTRALPKGIYFYTILKDKKIAASGKLVVE